MIIEARLDELIVHLRHTLLSYDSEYHIPALEAVISEAMVDAMVSELRQRRGTTPATTTNPHRQPG